MAVTRTRGLQRSRSYGVMVFVCEDISNNNLATETGVDREARYCGEVGESCAGGLRALPCLMEHWAVTDVDPNPC